MSDEKSSDETPSDETPTPEHENEKERVDRELIEFLNEVRVVLPGVQVLFAFLLTVPFTGTFGKVDGGGRVAYIVAFFFTALAAALMITPTPLHRLQFRTGVKEGFLRLSNQLIVAGIACLAIAMVSVVWLVAVILWPAAPGLATAIGAIAAGIVVTLWFVLPLVSRFSDGK